MTCKIDAELAIKPIVNPKIGIISTVLTVK